MDNPLIVIGLLVLVTLDLAVAGWFIYKSRIKRGHAYGLAAALNRGPGRVRLRFHEPFKWRRPDHAEPSAQALRDLGFQPVAGFSIYEIPGSRLFVAQHPADGLIALVYDQESHGTWSDVMLYQPDRIQPILASNIKTFAQFYFLPGDPKIHKPGASAGELVAAVKAAAGANASGQPMAGEQFRDCFEQAFADATDARLLRKLEDQEIRRLLADHDEICAGEITDAEFALVKELLPLAIENELRLVCGAQFLHVTPLFAEEAHQAREHLLVVHDRTPPHLLPGRLVYGAYCTKTLQRRLPKTKKSVGSPREVFARFNLFLPPNERYKKLGEVSKPVPADIYLAPLKSNKAGVNP